MNPTDAPVGQPGAWQPGPWQPGPWQPADYGDPGQWPGGRPPRPPMRRWVRVLLALVAVPVTLVAAVVILALIDDDDTPVAIPPVSYPGTAEVPGPLLGSLREKPVTGWSVDLLALLPRKATRSDSVSSEVSYLGAAGDRGYFMVVDSVSERSWLLGLDAATGRRLFDPVAVGGERTSCFRNGSTRLLCVSRVDEDDPDSFHYEHYVVDAESGRVLSHGPSELRAADSRDVKQAGDYAIAIGADKGIHGIGDDGKPSWFVADAKLYSISEGELAGNFATIAIGENYRAVLSLADGAVIGKTRVNKDFFAVYDGGFLSGDGMRPKVIRFHDRSGAVVGQYKPPKRSYVWQRTDGELPRLVFNHDTPDETQLIFDERGVPMTALRGVAGRYGSRAVGANFYLAPEGPLYSKAGTWTKYSLRTGERVSQCRGLPLGPGFVGSDGTVVLGRIDATSVRAPAIAVDTNTCNVLWQTEESLPVWAVGATLIAASPKTHTITALVPPGR